MACALVVADMFGKNSSWRFILHPIPPGVSLGDLRLRIEECHEQHPSPKDQQLIWNGIVLNDDTVIIYDTFKKLIESGNNATINIGLWLPFDVPCSPLPLSYSQSPGPRSPPFLIFPQPLIEEGSLFMAEQWLKQKQRSASRPAPPTRAINTTPAAPSSSSSTDTATATGGEDVEQPHETCERIESALAFAKGATRLSWSAQKPDGTPVRHVDRYMENINVSRAKDEDPFSRLLERAHSGAGMGTDGSVGSTLGSPLSSPGEANADNSPLAAAAAAAAAAVPPAPVPVPPVPVPVPPVPVLLDWSLLFRLAIGLALFTQGMDLSRAYMFIFLSLVYYLVETGIARYLYTRFGGPGALANTTRAGNAGAGAGAGAAADAMAEGEQQEQEDGDGVDEGGPQAQAQNEPRGLQGVIMYLSIGIPRTRGVLIDVFSFFAALVLSLLPTWYPE